MKALRIQVDFTSGKRAKGKLEHKDKNLRCNSLWQNLDDGVEIRIVVNGDTGPYAGIEGVEILDGPEAIDAAVKEIQPAELTTYTITSEALLGASLNRRRDLDHIIEVGGDEHTVLGELQRAGVLGISANKREPPTAERMAECWDCKQ